MAVFTADDLLLGPRGRGVCLAVAAELSEAVWTAWVQGAWNRGDTARRSELIRTLGDVDPAPVRAWHDPLAFLGPVDASVCRAMYWQEPADEDLILAEPDVTAALRPTAEAIAASPAAAWWSAPAEVTAPRYTSLYDGGRPEPPTLTGARKRLDAWHAETVRDERDAARTRPSDPTALISGSWWSTPVMAKQLTTTRSLPGLGSIALAWGEDGQGERNAAIWPLAPTRTPRVWEIDGPDAWTALVARYPLDVPHARRHDWYRVTARDGPWRIPDWRAVAADWDAAHLSVTGYLATATRPLPLPDGAATVLAGWDPDQTWWLSDLLTPTTGRPETWHWPQHPSGPDLDWRLTG